LTEPNDKGYLWRDVPADVVLDFVRDYKNHDGSIDTQMPSVHRFISHIKEKDGKDCWDVLLVSLQTGNATFDIPIEKSIRIITPEHNAGKMTTDGKGVEVSSRRRMASQGVEKAGLTDEQVAVAEASDIFARGNMDRAYRERRQRPLLVLFLTTLKKDNKYYVQVPVYGISFPRIDRNYEYEGEEYMANPQYMREYYGQFEDEEEDEYVREER
jgi:hypothetical protein